MAEDLLWRCRRVRRSKGIALACMLVFVAAWCRADIPVASLRSLFAHAQILFHPPLLLKEHLRENQEFRVQLLTPPQGAAEVTVDLSLSADAKDHRSFHAVSRDGRTFVVQASLLPALKEQAPLQLTLRSHNNEVVGFLPDQSIRVGGIQVPLSRVSQIENGSSPQVILVDLSGKISLQSGETVPPGDRWQILAGSLQGHEGSELS